MDERDDSAGSAEPDTERARAERGERPERGDRPERGERPERGDRPERAETRAETRGDERLPRADRERAERERADRERVERAERAERERAEWQERERTDRSERNERADRERADRSERDRADRDRERAERERAERERNELPESLRQRLEAMVPEMVKRTFSAGLGALFSTEENLRRMAKDISIPDVAGYIASTADNTKDKVLEIVAREIRDFLEHVNLSEEVAKLLTTLSFEVRTEIRFVPNSERYAGVDPSVKASVRLKKNDRAVTTPPAADEERGSRLRFWRRGSSGDGEAPEGGKDDDELEDEDGPEDDRPAK